MKSVCLLVCLLPMGLFAQSTDSLHLVRVSQIQLERRAMTVLASWAGVNLATGLALRATVSDPQQRAFWEMNAGWNVINMALAAPTLLRKYPENQTTIQEIYRYQRRMEHTLLFNAGLDVGYIAGGLWMLERGIRLSDARWQGYGRSIMVQGGFLLCFDATTYLLFRQLGRTIPGGWATLAPAPGGIALQW